MDRPRVLIADDEPEVVDIVRTNLEGYGYSVMAAYDGQGALKMIREEKPDLVLLDILMPKMDGWEVLEQLLADPELRGTPVIMLTALAHIENIIRGLEKGAGHYMTKPFHPLDLVAAVRSNLGESDPRLRQQHRRLLAQRRTRLMRARDRE